ncbi:TonB-dependent receptor plug domain-containing protein [Plebeiibacterium sediminum]|uniref:TonB-dependent receptor n=1 Tax=Plebeiibacterium sediminum TaxID=2992112 RepID=A0AAE3SGG9_9BACT|nr:TonB-dependent receptor [Plebeiobacterium sediminum]MCW3788326.1 TonB-dependent receptor [Plebeiobacterium sediminum]
MINKYLYALILLIFSVSIYAQESKKDVNSISREEVLQMNIEELSAYDLEEIMKLMDIVGASTIEELYELLLNKDVTSASKSEESLFDSSLSTTVLSYEEIVSNGATSIEEALKLVPGIIIREKTNGNYDVQIRGGQNMPMNNMLIYAENTTTLVMIDGRPVFNYGMGGILWETLPVSLGELDRIEVVRGPSSALYGPNAVNGVINLITKETKSDTPLVSANFQGGTLNTIIGDVSVKKQFSNKFSAGVSYYLESRNRGSEKIYAIYDDQYYTLDEYNDRNAVALWDLHIENDVYNDPKRGKEKQGINAYATYNANDDLSLQLSTGYLDANAITSTIGDTPSPYNQRISYGYYTNLTGNIYGFNLQACLNNTLQVFNKKHIGWTQETEQYNISLDYLLKFNKLSIRPGLSYQSIYYDDRDHIENIGDGYFNGRVSLKNYAVSARFDYHPTDKLRFVAALRDEKYNKPDKWQPSFQFTGSYKINDNNLLRAVYSRANQSTFMINAFSNYTWNLEGTSNSVDAVHFGGSAKPSMMIQDMFEIGYRTRPAKNLLIDIEAFYNKSKDYSALMPDSMRTNVAANLSTYTTLYTSYRDLDIKSEQYGISVSADMVLSEKLLLKAHFTYQQSKVTDLLDLSRNQVAGLQGAQYQPALTNDITNYYLYITGQGPYADAPNASYSSGYQPGESYYKDMDNEAIPSFWGSLSFTYKPTDKLDITAQGYYYDKYYLYSQYETSSNRPADPKYTGHIDGKFSLNAKVNYKINNNISVFVNARNVLNNDTQEYVFMDKIGGLYLAGFNFKL